MQHRARYLLLAIAIGASVVCSAQLTNYRNGMSPDGNSHPHPSITGLILGMDGHPLHDIRIEVKSLTTGAILATEYSNPDGTFGFSNLRPGEYEVSATDGLAQTREEVSLDSGFANISLHMAGRGTGSAKGTVSVAELRAPEKARHLLEKARTALGKNNANDAQKHVDAALALDPDYPAALTMRAVLSMRAEQTDAAITDLDHAVKTDSAYGPAYLVLGAVFNEKGKFDEALRSLDRSSMFEPHSWQCAFEMSKAFMGKHDYQRALQQLNRAQSLGAMKMDGALHILRGYAQMGLKNYDQAATELEAYLTAEPNGQLAGKVRMSLAKIKTAISNKAGAVSLTPAVSGFLVSAE